MSREGGLEQIQKFKSPGEPSVDLPLQWSCMSVHDCLEFTTAIWGEGGGEGGRGLRSMALIHLACEVINPQRACAESYSSR